MQNKLLTCLRYAIIIKQSLRYANKGGENDLFKNLNAEQARRGFTNSDVAKKLNISRVSYESKKKSGKFTTLEVKTLCSLFQCKFDYLFATDDAG